MTSGKTCHHSQRWRKRQQKHHFSPPSQPLASRPRSFEARRQSRRKTGALLPARAACHQTQMWGVLQESKCLRKPKLARFQYVNSYVAFAQELAFNTNPRDEYCWRKIWASLQLRHVNCELTPDNSAHFAHQRNSRCVRRWYTCWPDIWRCGLCSLLQRVRWKSSGRWVHTWGCYHVSLGLWERDAIFSHSQLTKTWMGHFHHCDLAPPSGSTLILFFEEVNLTNSFIL